MMSKPSCVMRASRTVAPALPHPILLADQLRRQFLQLAQIGIALHVVIEAQRGKCRGASILTRGRLTPAIFQIDLDQLFDEFAAGGKAAWSAPRPARLSQDSYPWRRAR